MGTFALNVAIAYAEGAERGERSQLSAVGVSTETFFTSFGSTINQILLGHRDSMMDLARTAAQANPNQVHDSFQITRDEQTAKSRWVDGTPEYSMHITGLRKLFPNAKFIHLVRDVRSVVRSMLKFRNAGDHDLVASEQAAYEYWLRTVKACWESEKAWGSDIIRRVQYKELVDEGRKTIHNILEFIGEPFSEHCLEPLRKRINSSLVPDDFDPIDENTAAAIVEECDRLWTAVQFPGALSPDPDLIIHQERAFAGRAKYLRSLDDEHERLSRLHEMLQAEFKDRTSWALRLNEEVQKKNQLIRDLQRHQEAPKKTGDQAQAAETAMADAIRLVAELQAQIKKSM